MTRRPDSDLIRQFLHHVTLPTPTTSCMLWTGDTTRDGYGLIQLYSPRRTAIYVHRLAHELWIGPIPRGHVVTRTCGNHTCVRPGHLQALTRRDAITAPHSHSPAARVHNTHCHNGHEYTDSNTYYPPHAPHRRYCRACRIVNHKTSRKRRKHLEMTTAHAHRPA